MLASLLSLILSCFPGCRDSSNHVNFAEQIELCQETDDGCRYLKLGWRLEQQGELDKAYDAYEEAAKSENADIKNLAFRRMTEIHSWRTQAFDSVIGFGKTLMKTALPAVLISVLYGVVWLVMQFAWWLLGKKRIVIVEPLALSPSGESHRFLAAEMEIYSRRALNLATRSDKSFGETVAKPAVIAEELEEGSDDLLAAAIPEQYIPLLSWFLKVFKRPKFRVSGQINVLGDDERSIFAKLKYGDETIRTWQKTGLTQGVNGMVQDLASEIVFEVEKKCEE